MILWKYQTICSWNPSSLSAKHLSITEIMWVVLMLAAVLVGESYSLPPGVPPLHSMMTEEEFKYYFGDKVCGEYTMMRVAATH